MKCEAAGGTLPPLPTLPKAGFACPRWQTRPVPALMPASPMPWRKWDWTLVPTRLRHTPLTPKGMGGEGVVGIKG